MKNQNKLAIVGIGNELCKDDGFGILVIRELKKKKLNLGTLIEGGTSGLSLIPLFFEYENLIFIDILKIDDEPGSIYIIPLEELGFRKINHVSIHDIGLEDVYIRAKMLGSKVNGYLVGIVPKDYYGFGEISDVLRTKIDTFIKQVIQLSRKL